MKHFLLPKNVGMFEKRKKTNNKKKTQVNLLGFP